MRVQPVLSTTMLQALVKRSVFGAPPDMSQAKVVSDVTLVILEKLKTRTTNALTVRPENTMPVHQAPGTSKPRKSIRYSPMKHILQNQLK